MEGPHVQGTAKRRRSVKKTLNETVRKVLQDLPIKKKKKKGYAGLLSYSRHDCKLGLGGKVRHQS